MGAASGTGLVGPLKPMSQPRVDQKGPGRRFPDGKNSRVGLREAQQPGNLKAKANANGFEDKKNEREKRKRRQIDVALGSGRENANEVRVPGGKTKRQIPKSKRED